MDGKELSEIVALRHEILSELLELGTLQKDAVASGHMNQLMQLLAKKQRPLQTLSELSTKLSAAIGDSAENRLWDAPSQRDACRQQHDQAEQLLIQVMQLESECEAMLSERRTTIEEDIHRTDGARMANQSYTQSGSQPERGVSLDLSSQ